MKHTFQVENIRCGGCENTIQKKLKEIKGVEEIQVNVEEKIVTVTTNPTSVGEIHNLISEKLTSLGYPEAGKRGSNNLKAKATSVVSCAIGKVSNTN